MAQQLQVEAPDFIAGLDLQQRLRVVNAQLVCEANDEIIVVVEQAAMLDGLLQEIRNWAELWGLQRLVAIRSGSEPPEFPRIEHDSADVYRRHASEEPDLATLRRAGRLDPVLA